ncbi:hypothetical protein [Marinibacterium sp. SX1]|uniref:hypothetical protein n=1 Tax=Marinibacterium sp. SX1 TaxID=3388424 RepID=UPI003D16A461
MMRPWVPESFAAQGLHVQCAEQPPQRFQVVGERSSGTNFVKRLLGRNTGLTPCEALGWKHGGPQVLAVPRDLLVVICVRGAADWALSMHRKPWHAVPALQALTFGEFLRAPWQSVIDRPRYFDMDNARALVGQPLMADRDPATGLPYANLAALRRGKLARHLAYLSMHDNVMLVRMEEATRAPDVFLDRARAGLGLPARVGDVKPVVKRLGSKFKPAGVERPETPDDMAPQDRAWLADHLDGDLEAALGYALP